VLVHLLLFLLLVFLAVSYLMDRRLEVEEPVVEKNETVVSLSPEFFQRVAEPPPVVEPVVEKRQQFARTNEAQEVEELKTQTRYIGERSTQAASELDATDSALAVPTQVGEEPKRPEQLETIDDQFADGVNGLTSQSPEDQEASEQPVEDAVPDPAELSPPPPPAVEDLVDESESSEAKSEDKKEKASEQEQSYLETQNALERPKEKKEVNDLKSEENQEEKIEEKVNERPKPPVVDENTSPERRQVSGGSSAAASGSEVKKTAVQGNISRRGTSSLAVQKTALGRYQASIGRAVEKEWQKNCLQYREHITPGYLTVRFIVNAKGEVTSLDFVESSQSGNIQNGFTLISIQNADIPKMPQDLIKAQDGRPIDMIFSFSF